jgi:DNA polymerase-4
VILPGRFDRYHEVARHLRQIWAEFSPVVEPVSVDEAYLDMADSDVSEGSIRGIAERLKARIKHETGLTASVGVGSSKLVAKIASDLDKPDGLVVIARGDEAVTLAPMSVRALPGVGPRTGEALGSLGITTLGQLAAAPYDTLARAFGADQAGSLLRRAVGVDNSPVQVPGDPKSVSNEITLVEDSCDLNFLSERVRELADRVAGNLKQEGLLARCIYIKLRLLPARRVRQPDGHGFGRLITRQVSLRTPIDAAPEVYAAAARLLETAAHDTGILADPGEPGEVVRLVGVGAASLYREDWVMRNA